MTEDAPSAPTDEEIGAAIRKIARAAGHDDKSFAWFANWLIRDAEQFRPENMPTRVGLVHDGPPDAITFTTCALGSATADVGAFVRNSRTRSRGPSIACAAKAGS